MFFNKLTIRKTPEKTMLKKILPKLFLFMVALVTVLILPVNASTETLVGPVDIIEYGNTRSPGNETVDKAIDNNVDTKFLNFAKEGNGFTVTFDKAVVVDEIEFTTANDDHGRDPIEVEISGSNQSPRSGFNKIADVPLTKIRKRFAPYGNGFTNETAYKYYQVVITGIDQQNANSFQFAEVDFYSNPPEESETPPQPKEAQTEKGDLRQCVEIQNGHDPYGTLKCYNEYGCEKNGGTWMHFNPQSSTGYPGCSIESPDSIAVRAKATLAVFSGNRSSCSSESAWQANCETDGGAIDLASCFALKDMPDNFEGLTPEELGKWQDHTYQCQTAMPLCTSSSLIAEPARANINDNLEDVGGTLHNLSYKNRKLPPGFAEIMAISQGDFTAALEGYANWQTLGVYGCAKSTVQLDAEGIAINCASMMTLGISDVIYEGAALLISLLEKEPKCQYNMDTDPNGDFASLAPWAEYDFGDWGMFPRSVRLECGVSLKECEDRDGWTTCNMGGNSCDQPSEGAELIYQCERRHGPPREGVACHKQGNHGKETLAAMKDCPDTWHNRNQCPVNREVLYPPLPDWYPWWPLQEGTIHPWANKVGSCADYDDKGYCTSEDRCANNPWYMSETEQEQCIKAEFMPDTVQRAEVFKQQFTDDPATTAFDLDLRGYDTKKECLYELQKIDGASVPRSWGAGNNGAFKTKGATTECVKKIDLISEQVAKEREEPDKEDAGDVIWSWDPTANTHIGEGCAEKKKESQVCDFRYELHPKY